ncbi:hypothetical protein QQ045_029583 [Rhodiola kirilowii]
MKVRMKQSSVTDLSTNLKARLPPYRALGLTGSMLPRMKRSSFSALQAVSPGFYSVCISDISALAKKLNVIDKCWRSDPRWVHNRERLATCSVGFAGKMSHDIGKGLIQYVVTDPSDDPVNPRPGTLRYGATVINGKVWITFQRDMRIKLKQPLLVSSFTTIDGKGFKHSHCRRIMSVVVYGNKCYHPQCHAPKSQGRE